VTDATGRVGARRDGYPPPMTGSPENTQTPSDRTTVPELVGLPAAEAHDRALDAALLAVPRNATHTGAGRGPVADQDPAAGEMLERGGTIRIWIEGGAARSATDPGDGPDGSGGGGGGVGPKPAPVGPAGGGVAG
jgi:hypothetical protein